MNICLGLYLVWFLQITAEKKSFLYSAICGILAAIIFYSYRGGIIYILITLIYLTYLLIAKKISSKILCTFVVIFITISFPWIIKIYKNPEKYNLRMRVVSLSNTEIPYHNLYNKTEIYKYQLITSIRSWIFLEGIDGGKEENPRYLPMKDPPVNLFVRIGFYIGIVTSILNLKKYWFWLLFFGLGIILGQIMTVNPPNGVRGLIMLPVIYLFFSEGLYKLYLMSGKNKQLLYMFIILTIIYSYLDFSYYQYWMTWIKV